MAKSARNNVNIGKAKVCCPRWERVEKMYTMVTEGYEVTVRGTEINTVVGKKIQFEI